MPTRATIGWFAFTLGLLACIPACAKVAIKTTFSEGWLWVAGIQPVPNDLTVDPYEPIAIEFAKDLDARSVTAQSFVLNAGKDSVPATVNYLPDQRIAVLEPAQPLAIGTTYQAAVTTAVRASSGEALPGEIAWTFRTDATLRVRTEPGGREGVLTLYDQAGNMLGQRNVRIVAQPR